MGSLVLRFNNFLLTTVQKKTLKMLNSSNFQLLRIISQKKKYLNITMKTHVSTLST